MKYGILKILLLIFLSGCETVNPEEDIPAYIGVNDPGLKSTDAQGTNSHNIADAWLYANDDIFAISEYGDTVPVLNKGLTDITVIAGIKKNGIATLREKYPFYTTYDTTIDLEIKKVHFFSPVFTYRSFATFPFMEDFEQGSDFNTITGNGSLKRESSGDTFEGTASGLIALNNTDSLIEVVSDKEFSLPLNGDPSYLELNYKADVRFIAGVQGIANNIPVSPQELLVINPKDDWNKIYISLRESAINLNTSTFRIYIAAFKHDSLDVAEVWLDNIKVVK